MKKVRSVSHVIRILEALRNGAALTVTELARQLKLAKSSAYEILATLVAEGFVEKDQATNRYQLGLRILELAYSVRHNSELARAAQPLLKKLNKEIDETVQLTVLDGDEILYLDGCESSKQLRTFFNLGEHAPLYCTALGKAILAFLPPKEIERIIKSTKLTPFTANTLTRGESLLKELAKTAQRGYSVDNREHEEDVRCIGAPIFNRAGEVFASISISGPAHRLPEKNDGRIARSLIETAREISHRLGYKT
jgi:IclR family KDG regulon transcriptional repressor